MAKEYYKAYDDRYRQVHGEGLKWFGEKPSPIVLEILKKYYKGGMILEIGCGEGRDAGNLLEAGYDLLATDVSEEVISFCRKQWPEYARSFRVLDCLKDAMEEPFDFIYAVAVIHMLVEDSDRNGFYRFIRTHLKENGIALICSMGDGETERRTDPEKAFELQERVHEATGKRVYIAGTTYRSVSFDTFRAELKRNGLRILEDGFTLVIPDYGKMIYAVVCKG